MFSQILKFRTWDSLNGCFSDSLLIQYQCNVSNMANRWRTSRNTHQTVRAPQNKVLVSFLFFFLVQLVQYIHKNHSSNSNPRRKQHKKYFTNKLFNFPHGYSRLIQNFQTSWRHHIGFQNVFVPNFQVPPSCRTDGRWTYYTIFFFCGLLLPTKQYVHTNILNTIIPKWRFIAIPLIFYTSYIF